MSGKIKKLPSVKFLKELFEVDFQIGQIYWKRRKPEMFVSGAQNTRESICKTWNANFAGCRAGSLNTLGYVQISIDSEKYLVHRIIYKMFHNIDPDFIDHINGIKKDNRISNLRSVSHKENGRNQCLRKNNKSGVLGVCFDNTSKKWRASINTKGKNKFLGQFETKEEAILLRKNTEKALGYHANHGVKR